MSSSVCLELRAEEKGLGDLASAAPGGDLYALSAVKSNRSLHCLAAWRLESIAGCIINIVLCLLIVLQESLRAGGREMETFCCLIGWVSVENQKSVKGAQGSSYRCQRWNKHEKHLRTLKALVNIIGSWNNTNTVYFVYAMNLSQLLPLLLVSL